MRPVHWQAKAERKHSRRQGAGAEDKEARAQDEAKLCLLPLRGTRGGAIGRPVPMQPTRAQPT